MPSTGPGTLLTSTLAQAMSQYKVFSMPADGGPGPQLHVHSAPLIGSQPAFTLTPLQMGLHNFNSYYQTSGAPLDNFMTAAQAHAASPAGQTQLAQLQAADWSNVSSGNVSSVPAGVTNMPPVSQDVVTTSQNLVGGGSSLLLMIDGEISMNLASVIGGALLGGVGIAYNKGGVSSGIASTTISPPPSTAISAVALGGGGGGFMKGADYGTPSGMVGLFIGTISPYVYNVQSGAGVLGIVCGAGYAGMLLVFFNSNWSPIGYGVCGGVGVGLSVFMLAYGFVATS